MTQTKRMYTRKERAIQVIDSIPQVDRAMRYLLGHDGAVEYIVQDSVDDLTAVRYPGPSVSPQEWADIKAAIRLHWGRETAEDRARENDIIVSDRVYIRPVRDGYCVHLDDYPVEYGTKNTLEIAAELAERIAAKLAVA